MNERVVIAGKNALSHAKKRLAQLYPINNEVVIAGAYWTTDSTEW